MTSMYVDRRTCTAHMQHVVNRRTALSILPPIIISVILLLFEIRLRLLGTSLVFDKRVLQSGS
jgi:hypothetical protein